MTIHRILTMATMLLSMAFQAGASLKFELISNQKGLSNSSVNCLTTDSMGKLWIGTWDGLNVYDGNSIISYKTNPVDPNTISDNIIRTIHEQYNGIIWVTTDYGVNKIDKGTGELQRFFLGYEDSHPAQENSFSLDISTDKIVFGAATGWGIAIYDESRNQMAPINIRGLNTSTTKDLFCIGNDKLLIHTTDNQLFEATYSIGASKDVETRDIRRLYIGNDIRKIFRNKDILCISFSDNSALIIDTMSGRETGLPGIESIGTLCSAIRRDDNNLIVANTSSDVYVYNLISGKIELFSHVSYSDIVTFCKNDDGILWIGTDGSGVMQVYNDIKEFNSIDLKSLSPAKIRPVRSFYKDEDNNLYAGTKGNGMYIIQPDGTSKNLTVADGLTTNSVYALAEDRHGNILIGHEGYGLEVYSPKTGTFSHIIPPMNKRFRSVYVIFTDEEEDCYWLGCFGDGLVRIQLDYENAKYSIKSLKQYVNDRKDPASLGNNIVSSILKDGRGYLWIGTRGGGLNRFNLKTEEFEQFTITRNSGSISSNDVLSLCMSRDSTLLIGTNYGINRLSDLHSGTFVSYTDTDILENNTIHGIIEDDNGKLWLSTNKGLTMLDFKNSQFINFYDYDSLQKEYTDGAYYKSKDGILYFGGHDGLDWFYPDQVKIRTNEPVPEIKGFSIKQQPLKLNENMLAKGLVLKHDENFFVVTFATVEYINNSNCIFEYNLNGFNDKYQTTGKESSATFTNIPPGRYTLNVRCTNGDKIKSPVTTSLKIRIKRPWYGSVLARLIYTTLSLLLLVLIYKGLQLRWKNKKKHEIAELKQKQQQEMYESKLRFFTDITHEFGTPLTLICGSSEQLLSSGKMNARESKYLSIIQNNASRMNRLIKEIMEFRKIDTGHRKPVFSYVCITDFITAIIDNFSELNEEKSIELHVDIPSEKIMIVSDRGALEKIIYNLISNAYKYTKISGRIDISLEDNEKETRFIIRNYGKGLTDDELHSIFNRFTILENFELQVSKGHPFRNGIGLPLALSLAKTLSGDIIPSSELGSHMQFDLVLPHIPEDRIRQETVSGAIPATVYPEPVQEISTDPESEGIPAGGDREITIMIVDDEASIRTLVSGIFSDRYDVLQADNGESAIELLKNRHVDLIITDLMMPRMNGVELVKFLKKNELTKFIPIIFLTFKNNIENEINSYEIDADAFVPKPFYPKQLKAIVARILRNRQNLKQYYNSAISKTTVFNGSAIKEEDKKFILQLTSIVEDNITDESMSPNFLCEKMFISRMHLYRKLKGIASVTPSEFIKNIKIEHAAHLLKTTSMTVQEIMYASGFNNKSYFYREFSEQFHMTPKEFRGAENAKKE